MWQDGNRRAGHRDYGAEGLCSSSRRKSLAQRLEYLAEGCPIPDTDKIGELGHITSLDRGIRAVGREKPDADPVADWKSSSTHVPFRSRSSSCRCPCLQGITLYSS